MRSAAVRYWHKSFVPMGKIHLARQFRRHQRGAGHLNHGAQLHLTRAHAPPGQLAARRSTKPLARRTSSSEPTIGEHQPQIAVHRRAQLSAKLGENICGCSSTGAARGCPGPVVLFGQLKMAQRFIGARSSVRSFTRRCPKRAAPFSYCSACSSSVGKWLASIYKNSVRSRPTKPAYGAAASSCPAALPRFRPRSILTPSFVSGSLSSQAASSLHLPLPFSARGLCRSQPFGRRLRFQRASPGIHHCHFAVLHSLH